MTGKLVSSTIYNDIAERCGGNIYVGVVGPVRSGKSTFIRRFMECAVLPNINDANERERAMDEMPQSASGKTVMTTEPKFTPETAATIKLSGNAKLRVKLIDCVGYIVPEALGQIENGVSRMVNTPWFDSPLPFAEAAEIGTQKVICDHSTIGMLVTTDGTIGEISRESYLEAEERVARELTAIGKPFAIILNSATPEKEEAIALAYQLEKKYNAPVALVNCLDLNEEDIEHILELVLGEFPLCEVEVDVPLWISELSTDHPIKKSLLASLSSLGGSLAKMGDAEQIDSMVPESEQISAFHIIESDLGCGKIKIGAEFAHGLYYKTLSEIAKVDIKNEADLLIVLEELVKTKDAYDKVAGALCEVEEKGYGIVLPDVSKLKLEEPEIVKQSGGYGVKLRAAAESIHMIKANIEAEISPMVGSEAQSEELVRYLLHEFEDDPQKIWESNLFGKSLYELINEGLHTKLAHMPEESRQKLAETLERIINEGSSGLICIIL